MTKDALIIKMLRTFKDLGNDAMARVDARLWFEHYTKKALKMGVGKRSVVPRKNRPARR